MFKCRKIQLRTRKEKMGGSEEQTNSEVKRKEERERKWKDHVSAPRSTLFREREEDETKADYKQENARIKMRF